MDLTQMVLMLAIFIPSLVLHEFAHAITATALGDPTPRWEGRLTLNPLAHFDIFGAIMIIITMITGFGIGWARPVGVDPRNFKKPARDMVLVAVAGPLSNILLAVFFGLILRFMIVANYMISPGLAVFLQLGTLINLSLAFFNLLPIPPLDGSRILRYFLKGKAYNIYRQLESYGMVILFGLVLVLPGLFTVLIGVPRDFLFSLITGLAI
ncbi:MAG TPA: site-2 protease family protein [Firmicutes bacterium]|nr:site-2 protease family protein [Bacillota bacterium]HBG44849.1 site-2 protease family protein [Bacillota bacterium]HBL68598.1 site-2 protease family protein [Bacillota bacterium]HCX69977.1 site-2 protease family protein [Bacillota bacterium]